MNNKLIQVFEKALKQVGYTEWFYDYTNSDIELLCKYAQDYKLRLFELSVDVYNFYEQKYIKRNVLYIVWDISKFKLFNRYTMKEILFNES